MQAGRQKQYKQMLYVSNCQEELATQSTLMTRVWAQSGRGGSFWVGRKCWTVPRGPAESQDTCCRQVPCPPPPRAPPQLSSGSESACCLKLMPPGPDGGRTPAADWSGPEPQSREPKPMACPTPPVPPRRGNSSTGHCWERMLEGGGSPGAPDPAEHRGEQVFRRTQCKPLGPGSRGNLADSRHREWQVKGRTQAPALINPSPGLGPLPGRAGLGSRKDLRRPGLWGRQVLPSVRFSSDPQTQPRRTPRPVPNMDSTPPEAPTEAEPALSPRWGRW